MMALSMHVERQPRELPMLFSAPMVNAILSGQKTVTRRVVKEPKLAKLYGRHSVPERHFFDSGFGDGVYLHWFYGGGDLGDDTQSIRVFAPWQAGDRIWVKETFTWITGNGIRPWYRADGEQPSGTDGQPIPWEQGAHWRPSIFMARHLSRITLEVVDVRAERLDAITEEDALAEGVEPILTSETWSCMDATGRSFETFGEPDQAMQEEDQIVAVVHRPASVLCDALDQFKSLWESINGERAGCDWASRPWVWRVQFRRIKP